jgi:hypothetical protein
MRWSSLVAAAAIGAYAAPAHADSASCTASAEQGQKARAQGKLVDAHRHFLACSAADCPAVVAKDCTSWAAEVLAATPTIVVDAKDEGGRDVGDATLTIDGNVIAHQLDGKAIAVDVGSHTVDVAANSRLGTAKHVTQTFIAKEGEKARRLGFVVPPPGAEPDSATAPGTETSSVNKIGPWIVTGIGAAVILTGIVMYVAAGSYPDGCNPDTALCARTASDPPAPSSGRDVLLDQRREDAGAIHGQRVAGTVGIIAGSMLVAGGLTWFFVARPSTRATIAPWYDVASGGLTLRSTF